MLPAVMVGAASRRTRRRSSRSAGAALDTVTGVDRDEREWIDRGVYDPGAPEAADRLAPLQYLSARGATTADLVAAVEPDGPGLPVVATELLQRRRPRIT